MGIFRGIEKYIPWGYLKYSKKQGVDRNILRLIGPIYTMNKDGLG